jgi:phosphonatase-like hydrolase
MQDIQLIVFDIAGTTIADEGQVSDAFRAGLADIGIEVTENQFAPWRGASKQTVLRAVIDERFGAGDTQNPDRLKRAYGRFREHLEYRYQKDGAQPIQGVEDTFRWLQEQAILIALTTGFYRRVTDLILEAVGWDRRWIQASICSDEVRQGRPAPYLIFHAMEETGIGNVKRVIKVGDTALDLEAGTNAGLRGVVGVLTGSQGIETLRRAPHTHVIPSVEALPDLMKQMV